jgi:hypothetical protein
MRHYREDGSITWMRSVMFAVIVVFMELSGNTARARDGRRTLTLRLNDDQLGESLKRFRSIHKKAICVVRPIEWSDERSFKGNWWLWVDCSLEKGVTFEGHELLAEVDPARPFGLFASFYKRKLVEVSYTLCLASVEALLPILYKGYGAADNVAHNKAGSLDAATWKGSTASLDVELVPIFPAVSDRDFLQIGKGLPRSAVRIRIHFSNMPSGDR